MGLKKIIMVENTIKRLLQELEDDKVLKNSNFEVKNIKIGRDKGVITGCYMEVGLREEQEEDENG